jgi:hypothetical protein
MSASGLLCRTRENCDYVLSAVLTAPLRLEGNCCLSFLPSRRMKKTYDEIRRQTTVSGVVGVKVRRFVNNITGSSWLSASSGITMSSA